MSKRLDDYEYAKESKRARKERVREEDNRYRQRIVRDRKREEERNKCRKFKEQHKYFNPMED